MNSCGPIIINIELTNKCNKQCWMCGRRKREKKYPTITNKYNKEINFKLLETIAQQLPKNIMLQLHNNGEPLMYSRLGDAIKLFENQITCLDTNGKLLMDKYDEIINNLDTITISTFQNDPEWLEQYDILNAFIQKKGNQKPNVIIRCLGDIDEERMLKYEKLKQKGCLIAKRILHSPDGSFKYKKEPVIPETGICMEMLGHPAINVDGDFSICVRFDPEGKGILGNIKNNTLTELWNSEKRLQWLKEHIKGTRQNIPMCSKCEFWGIPRG